jgi:hypothetical protein
MNNNAAILFPSPYASMAWSKLIKHRISFTLGCLLAGRPMGRSSNPIRVKKFNFSTPSRQALCSVYDCCSPGVKRPEREADHSLLTSAEIKKTLVYTSTPPYGFKV